MNIQPNKYISTFGQKFFWRFILLFLMLYIVPYDLAFGFSEKFEEWRWWHKPIFWIGEQLLGWEFDYENPSLGWDSKFEVCRYIFIFILGSLLTIIWLLLDYYYLKRDYEEKLLALVQTFLRYRIAIVMLHYGLAKVFMYQFGTTDINTLESTIGDAAPMGLMWKFLSYSKTVTLFSGWMECIGAFLLFFRRTTFISAFILVGALASVVLMDIGYNVSVTLYAIQLLLLTLVLLIPQFKSFYNLLITGKPAIASKYKAFIINSKLAKVTLAIKSILLIGLAVLFAKDTKEVIDKYLNNSYVWFTGLHKVDVFTINNDTITDSNLEKKWKKLIFNDLLYLNDSFKVEYEDVKTGEERFKYEIDSVNKTITYREYEDDKASWNVLNYRTQDEKNYYFEGVFRGDSISVKTTIKRLEDYNLTKQRGRWLIDLK